jgi:Zn-finger nucleic acid-binding protein
MSERQGIEIDYCPSCRGVWLDRGELDKIIERNATPPAAAAAPPPAAPRPQWGGHDDGYGRHHHPHRKRRKSFLEELFD